MNDSKKIIDPPTVKNLLRQLIAGIAKVHEKRIVHRDLKPANILLDKSRNFINEFS